MTNLRAFSVGETFSLTLVEDLKRTQIVQYAGASGDYNPMHTDEIFATKVAGYPSTFAHGMLTMGMTARIITDLVAPEHIKKFSSRFTKVVFPGDDLHAHAEVTSIENSIATISISTKNQDGDLVLSATALVQTSS